MGIQDRDYMRDKRLRWDERSGELRLDDASARRVKSRWSAVAIAVGCAAAVALAGWMWWRAGTAVGPGSASEPGVEPAAGESVEQAWTPAGAGARRTCHAHQGWRHDRGSARLGTNGRTAACDRYAGAGSAMGPGGVDGTGKARGWPNRGARAQGAGPIRSNDRCRVSRR